MCCRGADYLYAPYSLSCDCCLLPQSGRAGLLFLCPRSPSFLLSVSPALQSPSGFPVAFCRSYRLSASIPSFCVPACLAVLPLPSGSPIALRFSCCFPVLLLPCGSPVVFRFSFVVLLCDHQFCDPVVTFAVTKSKSRRSIPCSLSIMPSVYAVYG